MSRYRKVDTRLWNDARFCSLSERGKLVFLFLITHPNLTMLGAMRASEPGLAAELGLPLKAFAEAFREGLTKGMAKHDPKASFVWLPNFLKYNKPESPNVVKAWPEAFDLIPECELRAELFERLKDFIEGLTEGFRQAFTEAFQQGFAKTLPNQEQEQEQEQEKALSTFSNSTAPDFSPAECDGAEDHPLRRPEDAAADQKKCVDCLVKDGFAYFLERTERSEDQYKFTPEHKKLGTKGFESLVSFARRRNAPDPYDSAAQLFRVAVDRLVTSPFHNGHNDSHRRYNAWKNLFQGKDHKAPAKLLEFWLDDGAWPE